MAKPNPPRCARGMMRLLAGLAGLTISPVLAADVEGNFAVDGIGTIPCERLTAATETQSRELPVIAGWIDGYVSGFNALSPETFDLTPWQGTEVLLLKIGAYCAAHPDTRLADATTLLIATLQPERMRLREPMQRVSRGDRAVYIYPYTLRALKKVLDEAGFVSDDAEGEFGPSLSSALLRYQTANDLPATGLPDFPTLVALLD